MQSQAILLIVISAFTHAGWNLVGKHERPTLTFFMVALSFGCLALLPVVWSQLHLIAQFPKAVWIPLLAGGVFQTLYHASLAGAYRCGELSVVYPMARALPLVFVAMGSILLGRGSEISMLCLGGCLLIVAGCLVLPLATFRDFKPSSWLNASAPLALAAALATVGYSFMDDHCMRLISDHLQGESSTFRLALLYLFIQTVIALAMMIPPAISNASERAEVTRLTPKRLRNAIVTGLGIVGTYSLVLTAMTYASDVTYIVAFRQLSIPIGAILGVVLLGEKQTIPKAVGLGTISIGLLLVAAG